MIAPDARERLVERFGAGVQFDVPLARHTSIGVGGPADALVTPADTDALADLVALAAELALPLHVLGGGFNTLVLDGGLEGLVVRTQALRALAREPGRPVLRAETGVSHARLTRFAAEQGLDGLAFGAGVPGSVGGWIAMNAGIPDAEIGDVVLDVELAGPGAARRVLARSELGFGYRRADAIGAGTAVLAARFALRPAANDAVRDAIRRHLAHRRSTQPVDQPSFGSVFVNPPGDRAGRLLELAGVKGLQLGGAQISSVHANFIVNRGGATAADVLGLIERAREAVRASCGIEFEPEVRIVGRPSA